VKCVEIQKQTSVFGSLLILLLFSRLSSKKP